MNQSTRASSRIDAFLHPRILKECLDLFDSGFFSQAALEAMEQVEVALRDHSGGSPNEFGVRLVRKVLDQEKGLYLHLSLDPKQQEAGRMLFEGAFRYYRNYAAHDGRNITGTGAGRVLILASEMLDMLGASERYIRGREGLERLIASKFGEPESFVAALRALDGEWFVDDVVDGFFERLAEAGISDDQMSVLVETGLLEIDQSPSRDPEFDTFSSFHLTQEGRKAIDLITGLTAETT